jgi:hypothetical protein
LGPSLLVPFFDKDDVEGTDSLINKGRDTGYRWGKGVGSRGGMKDREQLGTTKDDIMEYCRGDVVILIYTCSVQK